MAQKGSLRIRRVLQRHDFEEKGPNWELDFILGAWSTLDRGPEPVATVRSSENRRNLRGRHQRFGAARVDSLKPLPPTLPPLL